MEREEESEYGSDITEDRYEEEEWGSEAEEDGAEADHYALLVSHLQF